VAKFKIVVTAGDGIGPEVIAEGVKVLKAIGKKYGHTFDFRYELLGGSAIDATGEALTKETLAECSAAGRGRRTEMGQPLSQSTPGGRAAGFTQGNGAVRQPAPR
jgi:3-isopropylmalate dehydrogenase